jgi:hypothetical protein
LAALHALTRAFPLLPRDGARPPHGLQKAAANWDSIFGKKKTAAASDAAAADTAVTQGGAAGVADAAATQRA